MTTYPRDALFCLTGWQGYYETPVLVVGETPKKYRIEALQDMRLAGRRRWLKKGQQILVPQHAVRFCEIEAPEAGR